MKDFLTIKKYIILGLFVLVLIFTGCDGLLAVRGYVINDETIKSHTISDSLFSALQLSNGIEGVFIQIDPAVQDSLVNPENLEKFGFKTFTDNVGYFEYNSSFAPGKWVAGLVVSKSGYTNDTIYFNSITPKAYWTNIIISLKKNN